MDSFLINFSVVVINYKGGKNKMEQTDVNDWRSEVEQKDVLKIEDGETADFTFLDEGKAKQHKEFGTSIVFTVKHLDSEKLWFVNSQNYDLLKQIKELGVITGMKVKVTRTGSKKSDTRYKLGKVSEVDNFVKSETQI